MLVTRGIRTTDKDEPAEAKEYIHRCGLSLMQVSRNSCSKHVLCFDYSQVHLISGSSCVYLLLLRAHNCSTILSLSTLLSISKFALSKHPSNALTSLPTSALQAEIRRSEVESM